MIDILDKYDKALMLYLNYDGGNWADSFWLAFSDKSTWIVTYLFIIITLYQCCKNYEKKWQSFAWIIVCSIVIIVLADQISSGLIKPFVERLRPSHDPDIQGLLHYVNNYKGGQFGFASSHAANTIGLAVWLGLLFRGWIFRSTILLWSLATCYSRIYLGVHYPGDIVGGLAIGILCALLVYFIYRKYSKVPEIPFKMKEPWPITGMIWATVLCIALI